MLKFFALLFEKINSLKIGKYIGSTTYFKITFGKRMAIVSIL